MKEQIKEPKKKKTVLQRLTIANLVVLLLFLVLTIGVLWGLGLWRSIFKFVF